MGSVIAEDFLLYFSGAMRLNIGHRFILTGAALIGGIEGKQG